MSSDSQQGRWHRGLARGASEIEHAVEDTGPVSAQPFCTIGGGIGLGEEGIACSVFRGPQAGHPTLIETARP